MNSIEVNDLHFSYAKEEALKGVNLSVRSGIITGILGPNGSGKSTLFKVLSTQVKPHKGKVEVFGLDVTKNPAEVRSKIGICFQSPSLDPHMSIEENLNLHGRLMGLGTDALVKRIQWGLDFFGLSARRKDRVKILSGGLARRAELIKVLLSEPEIMLLDEPTSGLDPGSRLDLWTELKKLVKEKSMTLVVTTHMMEEADFCEELVFISDGQIRGQGSPDLLKKNFGAEVLTFKFNADSDAQNALAKIKTLAGGEDRVRKTELQIRWETPRSKEMSTLVLENWGPQINEFTWGRPSLSDVYFQKTGRSLS